MKNQYVGDVSDFAKYGLLKQLCGVGSSALRLGIIWYLTEDVLSRDGRRIQYLRLPRPNAYSNADSVLLDKLARIVQQQRRDILQIAQERVLPASTVFFQRLLTANNRGEWFEESVTCVAGCDVVFLDPDNGVDKGHARVPRRSHATVDEIVRLHRRGHSVIVIQFFHRLAPHPEQLQAWMNDVVRQLPSAAPMPFALRWRTNISLGFMIFPTAHHGSVLVQRTADLLQSSWGSLFEHHPWSSLIR